MAQYTTGTATGPGALYNFLVALKDHAVLNGWTLVNTINASAGTYDIVLRGGALDATADNRPIVRFTQTSTSRFYTRTYSDWDSTAVAGFNEAGAAGSSYSDGQDASFTYILKINSVAIAWAMRIGTSYNRSYAGFVRRGLSTAKSGLTKTSAAYAASVTTMNVASDMTTKLKVGQKVTIVNNGHSNVSANKSNAEVVEISSMTATSITFAAATTKAYDSGAIIGWNPIPSIVGLQQSTATSDLPMGNAYSPLNLDGTWTSTTGQTNTITGQLPFTETNVDPDDISGEYAAGPFSVVTSPAGKLGARGFMYHYETCSAGAQAVDDIMDDGTKTFLIIGFGASGTCMLGPRED